MKKTIVVAGAVRTRSGYGAHARDICKALIKSDKYNIRIVSLRWGSTPQTALDASDPDDKMILDRIVQPNLGDKPDVFIHITIPNEFQPLGKVNIGLTAGIESNMCRPEWLVGCNRMDLVIATSEHSKSVFENTIVDKRDKGGNIVETIRLTKPVKVLFEGIIPEIYNKTPNKEGKVYQTLNTIKEKFCFLFVGHWLQGIPGQDRKDIGMLVKTFLEVFKRTKKKDRPALILKTSEAGFSEVEWVNIERKIQEIKDSFKLAGWNKELPNVYVLYGDLSDAEMNDLYNHRKVKAMVSFTKGEGFGRPLLEFTTTGKPVIASGWSGQVDFLHPQYSLMLPGQLTQVHPSAANEWVIKESSWFTVDYNAGGRAMQNVFDYYDKVMENSRKHRKYTLDNFSFEKMGDLLCEYIENATSYEVKEQPAVSTLPKLKPLKIPQSVKSKPPVAKRLNLPKLHSV